MASVQVTHANQEVSNFKDARNWVIDKDGRLHVIGMRGNLASFNVGHWESAAFMPTTD